MVMCLSIGCKNDSTEGSPDGYIGGRILNPTSREVIILKDNIPLDTVQLDRQNMFGHRIPNAVAGIYHIKHSPENHIFFLEAGDSILLRANSIDFDGSLHFSGKGGEKNNFLSNISLNNAENTQLVLSYYKIPPKEFTRRADSIRDSRLDLLSAKSQKHNFSQSFREVARKTIEYENYDLKERYTYMVNKYFKAHAKLISEDFHAYRNNLDFNETSLQTNPSYIRFIENHLINRAMKECSQANRDNRDCYDLYDHHNITTRIHLIDSITQLPLIREHFFSKFSVLGIIMAREKEEIVAILDIMKEKGYNEEELERLTNVGRVQLAYLPGMNIERVPVLNIKGKELNYGKISNKPAVIFLWSIHSRDNHRQNHRIIRDLRKKYPEIAFIGVNVDPGETASWIQTVRKYGYDEDLEFQLAGSRIDRETFQYYLNKVLLVNASGEVYKGDAYINSPEFETRILELLNQ